jgi:hypothetical protein
LSEVLLVGLGADAQQDGADGELGLAGGGIAATDEAARRL